MFLLEPVSLQQYNAVWQALLLYHLNKNKSVSWVELNMGRINAFFIPWSFSKQGMETVDVKTA